MLELMCQPVGDIIEATTRRRTVCRTRRRHALVAILLVGIGVVVEIALAVDAARRLLRAPHLLLAGAVGEGLWECGGGGGEGTTLLGGEVWLVAEAEVELEAVGVAVVLLLLLLLVRHGGRGPAAALTGVSRRAGR